MTATAEMNAFDRAITSDTGDVWLLSVDSSAPPFSPLVLGPGESGTIAVTITPARGHERRGCPRGVDAQSEHHQRQHTCRVRVRYLPPYGTAAGW
jgi:hypothetical protein